MPENAAYDYTSVFVRPHLLKEIEMVFYSEEYRYAGHLSMVWSTGIRSMDKYIKSHCSQKGLKIFEWNYA